MKKIFSFAAVIIVTASVTLLLAAYFSDESPYPENVIQTKITSAVLGQERELIIHLPRNYDSTLRYPVMYVLDGGSEDQHMANKLDILSVAGQVPPLIVVGIPNMTNENRQTNLTPPFMRIDNDDEKSATGDADRFLSFIEKELIPFIDQHYATSEKRLISGNSRGGLLVMYSLIAKPDLFQARFCYSAPFWRQDAVMVTKVDEFMASQDTLSTFLYMSAGSSETDNIKMGVDKMDKMLKANAPQGFTWNTYYTANAIHQNNARISSAQGIALWGEYERMKRDKRK